MQNPMPAERITTDEQSPATSPCKHSTLAPLPPEPGDSSKPRCGHNDLAHDSIALARALAPASHLALYLSTLLSRLARLVLFW